MHNQASCNISITRCSMRQTRETALLHAWVESPIRPHNHRQLHQRMHVHNYYIQQSGRSVKTINVKNTKQSPIHKNADANITSYFGGGDISRFRSRLPLTRTPGHIVCSIIVRYGWRDRRQQFYRAYISTN